MSQMPTKDFRKQELLTKYVHVLRTSNDLKQLRNERQTYQIICQVQCPHLYKVSNKIVNMSY